MPDLLNIFPFHTQREESFNGTCRFKFVTSSIGVQDTLQRGHIHFDHEREIWLDCTINFYLPSNAFSIIINTSPIYSRLDHPETRLEEFTVNDTTEVHFLNKFPDEKFEINIEDIISTGDKILFLGSFQRAPIINEVIPLNICEQFLLNLQFDTDIKLIELIFKCFPAQKTKYLYNYSNTNYLFMEELRPEGDSQFFWPGYAKLYYSHSEISTNYNEVIDNEEANLTITYSPILIESKIKFTSLAKFEWRFLSGNEFLSILLYTSPFINTSLIFPEKMIIHLNYSIYNEALDVTNESPLGQSDSISELNASFKHVAISNNYYLLFGEILVTTRDSLISQTDIYNFTISFKNSNEFSEFIGGVLNGHSVDQWYITDNYADLYI